MIELSIFKNGKRLQWALVASIFFLTALCYWKTVSADFVRWDDDINIYRNPHLKGIGSEQLYWMFTDFDYMRRYVPLAWLGWGLNYELDGLNPSTYHLGNILLQCLNGVLIFFLLQRLLLAGNKETGTPERQKAVLIGSGIGALLWAIHPLRVEIVAWASGRIYIQALFFLLISALGYLKFISLPSEAKSKRRYYWMSVGALAASLLTYPIGLGFVPVLIILDFYPLRRYHKGFTGWWDANARRIWIEKIPYILAAGMVFGMTLWARTQSSGIWSKPVSLEDFGIGSRLMQGFYIWAYYAWKPWLPTDLSPVYTTLVSFDPADKIFLLSLVAVVTLTALLIWKWREWPMLLTLWLCHLILLVPMLGLTEHPHYPSDRYDYIPGILWSVLIAAGLTSFWRQQKRRVIALAMCVAGLGLFGWLSFQQTRVWQNSITLFEHMIAKLGDDPYRADIHWRLGEYLFHRDKLDAARYHYSEVLKIWPTSMKAHSGLGDILVAQGKPDEALAHYAELVRLNPDQPIIHTKIGIILAGLGKIPEAIASYQTALQQNADIPMALNNLAWILATTEDPKLRNATQAVQFAERACQLTQQQQPITIGTLAAAYAEAGRFKEAIEAAKKAQTQALAAGEKDLAATNQKLIDLFKASRPFREPARSSITNAGHLPK